jgi:hypothetical protein
MSVKRLAFGGGEGRIKEEDRTDDEERWRRY